MGSETREGLGTGHWGQGEQDRLVGWRRTEVIAWKRGWEVCEWKRGDQDRKVLT